MPVKDFQSEAGNPRPFTSFSQWATQFGSVLLPVVRRQILLCFCLRWASNSFVFLFEDGRQIPLCFCLKTGVLLACPRVRHQSLSVEQLFTSREVVYESPRKP